jgi:predicted extracellular nuclease
LGQTFEENAGGGIFTVAVTHLKSKGSDCNDVGDPDTGNGAGNCNLTRKAAAEALVDWLAADPTGSGDADFLIIGDLNSYDKEDPIDAVKIGADDTLGTGDDYSDLVFQSQGEAAYTYVFDGQIGNLDYALASAGLLDQVSGLTIWHINADEPDLLDYDTSFKQPAQAALYEPNAYRSADHDPVIVGLDLSD